VTWAAQFRRRQYLQGSLWLWPLVGGLGGIAAATLNVAVDRGIGLPAYWNYSASTANSVLSAIVGASAALTGFVVTVSVLAVQMTTGTFSARYMRLWYRSRMLKTVLTILIGTLTFSFTLLRHVESESVPDLGVTIAGVLLFACVLFFIIFFDGFLHRMRPVAVVADVAAAGRRAFEESVRISAKPGTPYLMTEDYARSDDPALVVRSRRAGSIQAIHGQGLVSFAREHDCLLVLPHAVGDFIPEGATLIQVFGDRRFEDAEEEHLLGHLALGIERTIDQDPAFAIRVMVDIAIKALSPAVNDPTTATQVIDHLGETLRVIGTTNLRQPPRLDEHPSGRVIMRARRWEDFLELGVTEIRHYAASSLQVNRRLRAMLDELHDEVLAEHRAAVADELDRLDASVQEHFGDSPDLDRARIADRQGLGGPS
jgi:uncharacterized membrane protein